MSLEKAESYLKEAGFLDHVIELKESTDSETINQRVKKLSTDLKKD